MNIEESIIKNEGRILVFDLAKNLTVAGTYHSLNQEDKIILEQLIGQSDVIASERRELFDANTLPAPFIKSLKYDPLNKIYFCSWLNDTYQGKLANESYKKIKEANQRVFELTGVQRDIKKCEFEFCEKVAKEKGKEFYSVDFTLKEYYTRVFNQTKKDKVRQILGLDKVEDVQLLNEIDSEREARMLQNIVKHEGPIPELKRKVLMPVGYTHAFNYQQGKHAELLQR